MQIAFIIVKMRIILIKLQLIKAADIFIYFKNNYIELKSR